MASQPIVLRPSIAAGVRSPGRLPGRSASTIVELRLPAGSPFPGPTPGPRDGALTRSGLRGAREVFETVGGRFTEVGCGRTADGREYEGDEGAACRTGAEGAGETLGRDGPLEEGAPALTRGAD